MFSDKTHLASSPQLQLKKYIGLRVGSALKDGNNTVLLKQHKLKRYTKDNDITTDATLQNQTLNLQIDSEQKEEIIEMALF